MMRRFVLPWFVAGAVTVGASARAAAGPPYGHGPGYQGHGDYGPRYGYGRPYYRPDYRGYYRPYYRGYGHYPYGYVNPFYGYPYPYPYPYAPPGFGFGGPGW